MSDEQKQQAKFYLTTPIYYVNARPHIGHAYTTIVADVIARRHRLLGDDTWFLTGTDEHGQKIERAASAAGVPPQQYADKVSASFRDLWARMGITNNDYIRTTDERHKRGVQKLWTNLTERGQIYLSTYTGQYSVGEEMFVDGPPGTIGPDGKPTETVTEENYFFRLSAYQEQLINLIESGELSIQPEVRKNEVLSFVKGGLKDLSISRSSFKWGIPVPGDEKHVVYVWLDALANYMTAVGYGSEDPADQAMFEEYWPADLHLVGKEIIRFHCVYWPAFLLAAGLPLPKAITAHGWLLFQDSENQASKMSKSKGNIVRTETILDAFGSLKPKPDDLPGPVLSDEAWKHEQDLFASDVLRYFLLREIPFGQDGSFSFDALVTRYNADLANGYGNLVSRTLSLISKYSSYAQVPKPSPDQELSNELKEFVRSLNPANSGETAPTTVSVRSACLEIHNDGASETEFSTFLAGCASAITAVDGYLSYWKPWKLLKSNADGAVKMFDESMYTAAEAIRMITALLYPILPYATAAVWQQLGLGDIEEAARKGELKGLEWGGLKPGTKLGPLSPIFPRAPKELIQTMMDKEASLLNVTAHHDASTSTHTDFAEAPLASKFVDEKTTHTAPIAEDPTHPAAPPRTSALSEESPGTHVGASAALTTERPGTPSHTEAQPSGVFAQSSQPIAQSPAPTGPETPAQLSIDDFIKIDLRVAQIVVAERIPKADKLLRLEVDLGNERRQILSGIAEWYTPEELIGRRIVVIANLAPRKMRGLESHGMLLAASHGEGGKPILATFSEDVALGSRLK